MTGALLCPQCGKPLPSDGPQGLCPACLLQAALPGQSVLESATTHLADSSPATAATPEAGARLRYFGDYELLEKIAQGGMGIVWKARQTSLNREVALKMIRAGTLASPDEVQRFLREAEAAANLQHPNIVAIHEVGEQGGQHYFSMDHVAGRDLADLVKDGPLAPRVAARYLEIIAEAIHFAHQRGTLHRDLKPQNVLIDANDQPRITDFGLAKIMKDDSRLTQSGVVMGSPDYMPPEQAAGRQGDVGPASDVYSLGAMLYELLTGRPPFCKATAMATLLAVMEDEPTAPRQLKADIPPDLETICLKCLEKSPQARYPTARALAEELERFLQGEPIQTRPASTVRKVVSWARRHPGALAAVAAFVMVALAVGVLYLFEENAFLRAQHADPTLTRVPGPCHEFLQQWSTINYLVMIPGGAMLWFFSWLGETKAGQPRPLGERTRFLAVGMALILVGYGVMILLLTLQAYVWEGEWIRPSSAAGIFWPIYFGLWILGLVIRDYRLVQYGLASRHLNAEQTEAIRRALEDWHVDAAIQVYCEAIPDAGWEEANTYVVHLAKSLRAQHPGKFVPPPSPFSLTLTNPDWKALLLGISIEAIILGVLWFVSAPSYPAAVVSHFTYSFLLGMALMAFLCVRGVGKGTLLLVSALVVAVVSETILAFSTEAWSRSLWPYFFGVVFGFCLMAFSFGGVASRKSQNELSSK